MLGAIEGDDAMLFEAVADINQSGWSRQIGMGVRYINGKLVHRFRAVEGAFYRSGNPTPDSGTAIGTARPMDRTRAFGFSGYGSRMIRCRCAWSFPPPSRTPEPISGR